MTMEKPDRFAMRAIKLLGQLITPLVCMFLLFVSGGVFAQEDGDIQSDIANSFDFKLLGGSVGRLEAHGNTLMGDMIDKKTGSITFEHTDISIPGNSGLEVALRRKLSQGAKFHTPYQKAFNDWVLDIPIAYTSYGYNGADGVVFNNGCLVNNGNMGVNQYASGGPYPGTWLPTWAHVEGPVLSVPGKGLSGFPGGMMDPKSDWVSGGVSTDYAGRCASVVVAPDGTKYKFGRHTFRSASEKLVPMKFWDPNGAGPGGYNSYQAVLYRKYAVYLITEVEDVHGNWVRYEYTDDTADLQRIYSNDNREITLNYFDGSARQVSQVTANGRTWNYEYAYTNSTGHILLHKVTLPDGRFWVLRDVDAGHSAMDYEVNVSYRCVPVDRTLTIKHPDGAVGTFVLRETRHIKSAKDLGSSHDTSTHWMMPQTIPFATNNTYCFTGPYGEAAHEVPENWPIFRVMSLKSKTLSGPNLPTATWNFEYRNYSGGSLDQTWTKITEPDGTVRTYTFQAVGPDHGLLKEIDITSPSGAGETIAYEYDLSQNISVLCNTLSGPEGDSMGNCLLYTKRPETQVTRIRDGVTYTTLKAYNKSGGVFIDYGRPNIITRYSTLDTSSQRIANIEYKHYTSSNNNIIGLVERVTKNDKEFVFYDYNAKGQVNFVNKFGALWNSFVYHADGNLYRVTDARGYTAYTENYHRGIPKKITLRDGNILRRTIDDNGWVTSETNARSYTTKYQYNAAGWMTLIDFPGSWADITVSYENLGAENFHSIERRGTKEKVTWYDAMLRPRLVRQNPLYGNGAVYVKTTYDTMGRVIFTSFPSTASDPYNGTNTTYDGLGRVVRMRENVSPYAATITAYLSGNRVRVIDPLGYMTTTSLSGFSSPNDGNVTLIQQPGGFTTAMSYDIYGNMLTATQSGNTDGVYRSSTQLWSYDSRLNLCRHYAPETRSKVFLYNAADQVFKYAEGVSGTTGCATSATSNRVELTYDPEGRIKKINFPSGTPEIVKNYDANGNVIYVGREGVDWTYSYDSLDNISTESLAMDGHTFNLAYAYDAAGNLTQSSLPTGRTVTYGNDGLGRPESVTATGLFYDGVPFSSLVSGIEYNVNNTIKRMVYGNGNHFNQFLNERLMPASIEELYEGYEDIQISSLHYSYDARGKITSIIDNMNFGNNKSMQYDGLGRLTIANGPWGAGSYWYDSLGNLRRKNLGSRQVYVSYNAAYNRPSYYTDTAGSTRTITHDTRGNVTGLGDLYLTYDRANQPTTLSGSVTGTYQYDGNLKRVKSVVDGKTIYYIYSAAGSLVHVNAVTDNKVTDYISAGGKTIARATNNSVTYLFTDHLGSPLAGSTTLGTGVAWREQYTPYGEKMIDNSANHDLGSFTGHIDDSATGLTYMQARYYDPVMGRFLSNDPVGFQGHLDRGNPVHGFNRYTYANNNPYKYVDPDGEFGLVGAAVGGGIGFVASVATQKFTGDGKINWGTVAAATVTGAAVGATGGLAAGAVAKIGLTGVEATAAVAVPSAGVAYVGGAVTQAIDNLSNEASMEGVHQAGAASAAGTVVGGVLGQVGTAALTKSNVMGAAGSLAGGKVTAEIITTVTQEAVTQTTSAATSMGTSSCTDNGTCN